MAAERRHVGRGEGTTLVRAVGPPPRVALADMLDKVARVSRGVGAEGADQVSDALVLGLDVQLQLGVVGEVLCAGMAGHQRLTTVRLLAVSAQCPAVGEDVGAAGDVAGGEAEAVSPGLGRVESLRVGLRVGGVAARVVAELLAALTLCAAPGAGQGVVFGQMVHQAQAGITNEFAVRTLEKKIVIYMYV